MLLIYALCSYFFQSTDLYLSWEEPLVVGGFFPKVHLYFCFHSYDIFGLKLCFRLLWDSEHFAYCSWTSLWCTSSVGKWNHGQCFWWIIVLLWSMIWDFNHEITFILLLVENSSGRKPNHHKGSWSGSVWSVVLEPRKYQCIPRLTIAKRLYYCFILVWCDV